MWLFSFQGEIEKGENPENERKDSMMETSKFPLTSNRAPGLCSLSRPDKLLSSSIWEKTKVLLVHSWWPDMWGWRCSCKTASLVDLSLMNSTKTHSPIPNPHRAANLSAHSIGEWIYLRSFLQWGGRMQTLVLMTDSQVSVFLFQQLYEEVCIFCHTLLKTIIFTIKIW